MFVLSRVFKIFYLIKVKLNNHISLTHSFQQLKQIMQLKRLLHFPEVLDDHVKSLGPGELHVLAGGGAHHEQLQVADHDGHVLLVITVLGLVLAAVLLSFGRVVLEIRLHPLAEELDEVVDAGGGDRLDQPHLAVPQLAHQVLAHIRVRLEDYLYLTGSKR